MEFGLFRFKDLVAPCLEPREIVVHALGLTPIEPNSRARQVLEKSAIVADENLSGLGRRKLALEPFDRRQVQMVGRFVKQQDVRRRRQSAGECGTSRFAAGQIVRCGVRVDFQLLEQIGRAIRVGPSIKAVFDIGAYCRKGGKVRFLRKVSHGATRL